MNKLNKNEKQNKCINDTNINTLGVSRISKEVLEEEIHTFAVDTGKLNTKACYIEEIQFKDKNGEIRIKKEFITDIFPSTVKINEKSLDSIIVNDIEIDYNCTTKLIGIDKSTEKDTEEHRMLLAKAMYRQYKLTSKKKFNIIIGCTLGDFLESKGDKTLSALSKEKFYVIEDEGNIVTLEINKIVVMPESIASKFVCRTKMNLLNGKNSFMIDFGGLNFSILKYSIDGKLEKSEIYYSEKGMNSIYTRLSTKCNMLGIRVSDEKIENMLKSGKIEERYDYAIQSIVNDVFDWIFMLLDARGYYKGESQIIFTGGGCQSLKQFIEKYFNSNNGHCYEIIQNSIFANVKGMYKLGINKLKDTEKLK